MGKTAITIVSNNYQAAVKAVNNTFGEYKNILKCG